MEMIHVDHIKRLFVPGRCRVFGGCVSRREKNAGYFISGMGVVGRQPVLFSHPPVPFLLWFCEEQGLRDTGVFGDLRMIHTPGEKQPLRFPRINSQCVFLS